MPKKLLPACRARGCKERAIENAMYCEKHLHQYWAMRLKKQNDTLSNPFYRTPAWRKIRAYVLAVEPLCRLCGEPATLVDHIKPIRNGGCATDISNLQPLCDRCHNIKRAYERKK